LALGICHWNESGRVGSISGNKSNVADPAKEGESNRPKLTIRAARISDLDRLFQIEQNCFFSDRLSRRSLGRQIRNDRPSVLVAEIDDEIAGYAMILFSIRTSIARLYSIAVDPAYRGISVGRRLMAEAERAAAGQGARIMRLEVRRDNEQARALYGTAGYQALCELPHYYADGCSGLRYEKDLSDVMALNETAEAG